MKEKRIFAKYGILMIDMTHQLCCFMKGDSPIEAEYAQPEIVIKDVPLEYIHLGIPYSDKIVSFHDPYADKELDINHRPYVEVQYDDFSVVMHNDPDNPRSYMDFRNVELLTPYDFKTNRFITWEEYDKNKHRNDWSPIFQKYADIVNNDEKYIQPHSKEYFEFDTRIFEDRFLVDETNRNGETHQVFEDLKIMFAVDHSFIRIIINKTGNGFRHWDVYSMELTFNSDGTFVDGTEYASPMVLEILRPMHDYISWIHEYVRNIGESIDKKYKEDN
jgi:hypothetical protein